MRFMRLLVMFDMPTKTELDKFNYRHFRKSLLDNGYLMLQYSVYYKIIRGFDMLYQEEKNLKENEPSKGSVICLSITECQYEHMKIIVGNLPQNDKRVNIKQISLF